VKDKERTKHDEREASGIVPPEFFAQIDHGENRKHRKRDDFLNRLELRAVEFVRADAVHGHLKAVLKEGDTSTGHDHLPQRLATEFQVAVPSKGHKDVGNGEQ
jgi:hypothetical protein